MLRVKIYKVNLPDVADNYQVFLNEHSWSMSADADQPNGVCMSSDVTETEFRAIFHGKVSEPHVVPVGIVRQVAYLAETYSAYIGE